MPCSCVQTSSTIGSRQDAATLSLPPPNARRRLRPEIPDLRQVTAHLPKTIIARIPRHDRLRSRYDVPPSLPATSQILNARRHQFALNNSFSQPFPASSPESSRRTRCRKTGTSSSPFRCSGSRGCGTPSSACRSTGCRSCL